jgi:conjugal transfer pilus assembly protein TraA
MRLAISNLRNRSADLSAALAASAIVAVAAYAGADTTFDTALTTFTDFFEGSGGAIITVMSLIGGVIGLASGRFSLGQVAIPVGVGVAAGTGVPIVTAAITATI